MDSSFHDVHLRKRRTWLRIYVEVRRCKRRPRCIAHAVLLGRNSCSAGVNEGPIQMCQWRTTKNRRSVREVRDPRLAIRLSNTSRRKGPRGNPDGNDYAYSTSLITVHNRGREGAPHAALRGLRNQK